MSNPAINSEIDSQSSLHPQGQTINYDAKQLVGKGSFGAVFLAKVAETGDYVAIKKVLQDMRYKSRELQIMIQLNKQEHPFIVKLKHYFITKKHASNGKDNSEELYLNLVLEYVPETIYSIIKYFNKRKEYIPTLSLKLYAYQMLRALAHIHGMGICHRDIKPHNLLVDPVRNVLKLCDFGSAKALVPNEPNVAYICSRFYRAPELIFGSTNYTVAVDVWSAGCVFAELVVGSPIFPGSSATDQLVEIIKVLGTPTKDELKDMNVNYTDFKFPPIQPYPWTSIFRSGISEDIIDLSKALLTYNPTKRLTAIGACTHRFFNDLRSNEVRFPDGTPLMDELFQFTNEELSLATEEEKILLLPINNINLKNKNIESNEKESTETNNVTENSNIEGEKIIKVDVDVDATEIEDSAEINIKDQETSENIEENNKEEQE